MTAETDDPETPLPSEPSPEPEDTLSEEERRLEQVWSEQDRQDYRRKVLAFEEVINELKAQIEEVRAQGDNLWDRFVSLALEKMMKQNLRDFLEDLQGEADTLTPLLTETTARIDKLTADIAGYQRLLGKKAALLESMTHRISTYNHLNMMIARIAGLEEHLLGKKQTARTAAQDEVPRRLEVNVPSDLLYLRVRLRTTRSASLAARYSKEANETQPALYSLLFRADRLRAELMTVATRMACLHDQAEYWQAFLEMPDNDRTF